jgi:hypothetical protein
MLEGRMAMHGGVARDDWHAIGLGYKKLLKDGTPPPASSWADA